MNEKSKVTNGAVLRSSEAINGNSAASTLAELRALLARVPGGAVAEEATPAIIRGLSGSWGQFSGSGQHSTWARKLSRAEALRWNPPLLEFTLERHDATVMGSSRAELHVWSVNLDTAVAEVGSAGRRQLYANDAPFSKQDALELARELRDLIAAGKTDERLKWNANGDVSIILSRCVKAGNQQTRASRNRRLKDQLRPVMQDAGWELTGTHRFVRTAAPGRA